MDALKNNMFLIQHSIKNEVNLEILKKLCFLHNTIMMYLNEPFDLISLDNSSGSVILYKPTKDEYFYEKYKDDNDTYWPYALLIRIAYSNHKITQNEMIKLNEIYKILQKKMKVK